MIDRALLGSAALVLVADVEGATASQYRALDFGKLSPTLQRGLGGGAAIDVVIDPSSEGAVRAVDAVGFASVSENDAASLPVQVRGDVRADYSGLSVTQGAALGEEIALDLFLLEPVLDFVAGGKAIALSPNDQWVYVVSQTDDALAVFRRDPQTGQLEIVQVLRDDVGDTNGLAGAAEVTVSPDGDHVYVASTEERGIGIFGVDTETGVLTPIAVEQRELGSLNGGPSSLTVAPDGQRVYVVGFDGNSLGVGNLLAVFPRDSNTGELGSPQVLRAQDGVEGLFSPHSVRVADNGQHIYVASLFDGVLDGHPGSIALFERNPTSGALSLVELHHDAEPAGSTTIFGLGTARSVALRPDESIVYVAGPGDLALAAFERNPADGTLDFSGFFSLADFAFDITTFDENIYVSGGSSLITLKHDPVTLLQPVGSPQFIAPAGIAVTSDGAYAYAPDKVNRLVAVFARDLATGALTRIGEARAAVRRSPLRVVDSVAVSPDGKNVYAISLLDSALVVFARDSLSGRLNLSQVEHIESTQDLSSSALVMSPDGVNVYAVAGSNADDAGANLIMIYERDAQGKVSAVDVVHDNTAGVDGISGAASAAISPDGQHLYVAGRFDSAIAVFARDGAHGELTFQQRQKNGVLNVMGLDFPTTVIVSPDGKHVYTASTGVGGSGIDLFSRDLDTGTLAFIAVAAAPVPLADRLAISPDGSRIYALGQDSLFTFSRNAASGALTSVGMQSVTNGFSQLSPGAIAVAPSSGAQVYVASEVIADRLVVFKQAITPPPPLTSVQVLNDGVAGVDGLEGAAEIAISPDGHHAYVAASTDDGIGVFERNLTDGTLTFVETRR